jgi:hypothetical protein
LLFPENRKISVEFQDFFVQVLERDPENRLTAAGILNHPFLST